MISKSLLLGWLGFSYQLFLSFYQSISNLFWKVFHHLCKRENRRFMVVYRQSRVRQSFTHGGKICLIYNTCLKYSLSSDLWTTLDLWTDFKGTENQRRRFQKLVKLINLETLEPILELIVWIKSLTDSICGLSPDLWTTNRRMDYI